MVTERVKILNKYLKTIGDSGSNKVNEGSVYFVRPKIVKSVEIKSLSKSFHLLSNTFTLINNVFEVNLFFAIVTVFFQHNNVFIYVYLLLSNI